MNFTFTLRAASTEVTFDLGDISRPGWGNPAAADAGILICALTVKAGGCIACEGDIDIPASEIRDFADFLRDLSDDDEKEYAFTFYDGRPELAVSFRCNRVFDLKGTLVSSDTSSSRYELRFESHFGSPYYRETLDELDDILCILEIPPGADINR